MRKGGKVFHCWSSARLLYLAGPRISPLTGFISAHVTGTVYNESLGNYLSSHGGRPLGLIFSYLQRLTTFDVAGASISL